MLPENPVEVGNTPREGKRRSSSAHANHVEVSQELSHNEPEAANRGAPLTGAPAGPANPGSPLPAPSRADAALAMAHGLTDHTDRLTGIGQMPLEDRAAALGAIHEELASVLHEAEG